MSHPAEPVTPSPLLALAPSLAADRARQARAHTAPATDTARECADTLAAAGMDLHNDRPERAAERLRAAAYHLRRAADLADLAATHAEAAAAIRREHPTV